MDLQVKVIPKASNSEVLGWEGNLLKVRINAVPEKGAANKELIKVLSKYFDVPKSAITIVRGEHQRIKQVRLEKRKKSPKK
ncbi:MAG: hypothetical protein KR126chlam3_01164 [Chlamydiae bacterium]|nr:hypothetical protein [Chlamydiota bacterium]